MDLFPSSLRPVVWDNRSKIWSIESDYYWNGILNQVRLLIYYSREMMRYIVYACLAFGFYLPVLSQNKDYVFEQITSEAGITFNAVSSIVEDNHGFIWFGTASGLHYYNTVEIIQYNFDPGKENTPPSNKISNLYKDGNGRIWICTRSGVCYFDETNHSFRRLAFKQGDKLLKDKDVSYILQYAGNQYLIVMDKILYHFELGEQVVREIKIGDQQQQISFLGRIEDDQIYLGTTNGKVFINDGAISDFSLLYTTNSSGITAIRRIDRSIWIGTEDVGIEVINTEGKLVDRYRKEYSGDKQIASNRIRKIVQRKNGEIWIGSLEGISIIDAEGILHVDQNLLNRLPHIGVFDLYVDKNDGVWVGTWAGGLAYFSEYNFKFPHVRIARNDETVSRSVVSSFAEDKDGSIWVGVENYGLEKFLPDKMAFVKEETPNGQWPVSRVKAIATGHDHQHWIGTLYEGLWSVKENKFDRRGDISGIFSSVLVVNDGVWVGTRLSGLIFYDTAKDTFVHFRAEDKATGSISSDQIWKVFLDSKENLWICSDFGLSVKYKNAADFECFYYDEHANSLSRNLNYTIAEDKNGKIWIGTAGAGIDIYDPATKSFSKFALNDAISNAEVYCFLQDHQGNIWFSTNQGIYVYNMETNTLRNFIQQDGVLGKQYHPNSGFISSSGKLFFGGGNGFNIIDPTTVKQNPLAPDVFLSKMLINNKPLEEQVPKFVNSRFPVGINKIELDYHQNSLTLGFVADNFIKSSGNRFRYRMENYIDEWIETSHGRDVSFTKIPPGDYTLEVLACNNDGIWSVVPKQFQIKIAPPVFLSWYAYVLYCLLIISGAVVIFRELRFREKSRADRILFSEKVKFFTNVSHEFRTPLTLVISPLNHLMKKFGHDPSMMDYLKIIRRNADRLLHLTNQVLDFHLIELNSIKLKREKRDIVSLCRNAFDCFEYEALEKQINCIFNSPFKSFYMKIDAEKVEKIVYNLLSNALKYSSERGQVILSIEQKKLDENSYSKHYYTGHAFLGNSLEIKVKDNGKGIKKNQLPKVFDRFFIDHERGETGIGIGLHMCQEYIHLHNGNIMVASEEDNGTVFSVNIPIEQGTEFEKEDIIIQYHFDKIAGNKQQIAANTGLSKTNKVVVYVEDNDELRLYFKNFLSDKYKVLTAKNGQQAFEIAGEIIPDLIISDILMPGMDGLELTHNIRKTTKTNHIPIILLTALSDPQYELESMSRGANAYITKPVDESFLFAKIENIFRGQEIIKKKFAGLATENLSALNLNDSFIEKAQNIVEKNLQNTSFTITEFAAQLGISRSSFQRKLKAEVNLSPTEFIRDIRLKRAIELMKSGAYNIDEIGLLVGFNSTSYFIRSFKKKYGKTPFALQSELKVQKN